MASKGNGENKMNNYKETCKFHPNCNNLVHMKLNATHLKLFIPIMLKFEIFQERTPRCIKRLSLINSIVHLKGMLTIVILLYLY